MELAKPESQNGSLKEEVPRGNMSGFVKYMKEDLLSGFMVFLIALPLCLGIAAASNYPPIAGVFTAIVGAILTTFLSNSELTIKGPAAGLIVIVLGCVAEFGGNGIAGSDEALRAYRMALGVGVAAGVIQILFGLLRSGALGEFFPTSAVHGMLAAIGVIIIAKQLPIALGVGNKGEPLELLAEIPHKIMTLNPEIALIGGISLLILFGLLVKNRLVDIFVLTVALATIAGSTAMIFAEDTIAACAGVVALSGLVVFFLQPILRKVPAPMIVILATVPLGIAFDLSHEHTYTFGGQAYQVGESFLVPVPDNMLEAITTPDFSGLMTLAGWKWVLMFALIGSLESLLSAKAVDSLDPYRRKTDLNRDLIAVGAANTVSAFVGGLPMISEIVRSRANVDNGAKTRFADLYHGAFLLLFVALVPWLIHRIPLSALGAMLVYTGFRLASPREFVKVYHVGREQFAVFVTTIVAVLATDLLIGIAIGIALEFFMHLVSYPPLRSLFVPDVSIEQHDEKTCLIRVRQAAVFTNWISLRRCVTTVAEEMDVVLDLSETHIVDHTVMEKLHELEKEFEEKNRRLFVRGLEDHRKYSNHPHAGRKRHPGGNGVLPSGEILPSSDGDTASSNKLEGGADSGLETPAQAR